MALVERLAAYLENGPPRISDTAGDSQQSLTDLIEDFMEDNAAVLVDASPSEDDGTGIALLAHDLHQRFLTCIEEYLEGFLVEEGLTSEGLRDILAAEAEEAGNMDFVQALLCSWEFESFLTLAKAYRQERLEEEGMEENDSEPKDDGVTVEYEGHDRREEL